MIEINFGASEWMLKRFDYSPTKYPDNIIVVPEKGEIIRTPKGKELPLEAAELPRFGPIVKDERPQALSTSWAAGSPPYNYGPNGYKFLEYDEVMKLEPTQANTQGYPSVIISRPRPDRTRYDIEVLMLWINKRNDWIVIWHRTWEESAFSDDECFDGPFALNEACANKILQAYGISKGKFTLNEVREMNPEELKQNSQSSQ
ncbi:hypothetical protein AMJ47_00570 [Parcubacteria bacterium DG_72]|nr:MAG: hypothetical protein AMJ47_00570 [Parcubacteria bacterium DG_72]